MNIVGFWIGFLVRCLITSVVFAIIIWRYLDWDVIAVETAEREKELE
jgi:hypothetical protein